MDRTFKTVNPKTEQVIDEVKEADKADVDLAVAGKSSDLRPIAGSPSPREELNKATLFICSRTPCVPRIFGPVGGRATRSAQ